MSSSSRTPAPPGATPLLQQAGETNAEVDGNRRARTTWHPLDIFFKCANRILDKGLEPGRTLTETDAEDLPWDFEPENARDALVARWNKRQTEGRSSLKMSVLEAFWPSILAGYVFHFIEVLVIFVSPVVIRNLVKMIENDDPNVVKGVLLAIASFLAPLAQSTLSSHFIIHCRGTGLKGWGATSSMVFEKTLRLSQPAAATYGPGAINNIMQIDANRFQDCFFWCGFLWSMPMMLVFGVGLLYANLGAAALTPLLVMVFTYPINSVIVKQIMTLNRKTSRARDSRVKILMEVVHALRLIKMLAWENKVYDLVDARRKVEMGHIARTKLYQVINGIVWLGVPLVLPLVTFGTYVALGGHLEPSIVFSTLALLDVIRIPMNLFPQALQAVVQINVSVERIEHFLGSEEIDDGSDVGLFAPQRPCKYRRDSSRDTGECGKGNSAYVRDASLRWADPSSITEIESATCLGTLKRCLRPSTRTLDTPTVGGATDLNAPVTLRVPSLEIPEGKLIFVCGAVGAGKSTLISGLLNEVPILKGSVRVRGPIAYCAQKPWILHGTVKDNVLFGDGDDSVRFSEVVQACALDADLKELNEGADTVIGERGVNLSGGQKARIGLARAAFKYPHANMFILDDPLSAVDVHVATHLMDALLGSKKGLLRHATRVVVTHQLQFIGKADLLIMMADGRLAACKPPGEFSPEELDAFGLQVSQTPSILKNGAPAPLELVRAWSDESDVSALGLVDQSIGLPWNFKTSCVEGESSSRLIPSFNRNRVDHLPSRLLRSMSAFAEESTPGPLQLRRCKTEPLQRDPNEVSPDLSGEPSTNPSVAHRPEDPQVRQTEPEQSETESSLASQQAPSTFASAASAPDTEEDRIIGALDIEVWLMYAREMGFFVAVALILCFLAVNVLNLLGTLYIGNRNSTDDEQGEFGRMTIYFCITLCAAGLLFFRMMLFRRTALKVSKSMHNKSSWAILRSPMSWLDITPTGRIVNRLSQDVQKLDTETQDVLSGFVDNIVQLFVSVLVLVYYTPGVVIVFIPLVFVYIKVQTKFRTTARELQRMRSRASSPICQGLDEVIIGVSTVRAFENQDYFIRRNVSRTQVAVRLFFNIICCNRWLCVRLRALGTIPIAAVTLAMVLHKHIPLGITVSGTAAGMVLKYSLQFSSNMEGFLQALTQTELCLVAIERLTTYSELPPEPQLKLVCDSSLQDWPHKGEIEFEQVVMRYRPDLPIVLNGVSFKIRGGTSAGVVGRTGAGKSSILQALFRMCAPESGRILIDGVEISSMGLHTLRQRLAIIPQDPVGFTGSLRFNLDPFSEREDSALWQKLEDVQLKEFVQSKELGLDFELSTGGENLSAGQMQLVCAARAFLRNAPILILDEATASVDYKTDELIQQVLLREVETKKLTTLTIAHRINTIMGAHAVIVMEKGIAVEMGPPKDLANDPASKFYTFANPPKKKREGESSKSAKQ